MSNEKWKQNIEKALCVSHISSYALTVEPKTAMSKMIQTEKWKRQRRRGSRTFYDFARHARIKWVYPLSNFGKQNYFSKNNPLIGWEKIYVLDLRRTVIMAFLEVGMYRTTSSI
jgi:oxygen-independent coproporphyrinogen-3 oxidase